MRKFAFQEIKVLPGRKSCQTKWGGTAKISNFNIVIDLPHRHILHRHILHSRSTKTNQIQEAVAQL